MWRFASSRANKSAVAGIFTSSLATQANVV
jgi:hypothetical protein